MSDSPEHGIRYLLEHDGSSEQPLVYRGFVDGELNCAVVVTITAGEASAVAPEAPLEHRQTVERTAAVMVRSAVKRAQRDGMPPPRRIQRWRDRY